MFWSMQLVIAHKAITPMNKCFKINGDIFSPLNCDLNAKNCVVLLTREPQSLNATLHYGL